MATRLDTPQNGFAIDWLGQRIRLPIRTSDTGGLISAQLGGAPPGFTRLSLVGTVATGTTLVSLLPSLHSGDRIGRERR